MNKQADMPDPEDDRPEEETPAPGHHELQPEPELDPAAERIAALEAELGQAKDQMLRAMAEAENTRKRLLREREDVRQHAIAAFARDMLDFADNFARALASIPPELKSVDDRIKGMIEGIEAMDKEMLKAFEKHGIKRIEPMHEPFNANFHEVMFEMPGSGKSSGTIVQIIEPGYLLHDRLLRPARVGVAKDEGQGGGDRPGGNIDTQA